MFVALPASSHHTLLSTQKIIVSATITPNLRSQTASLLQNPMEINVSTVETLNRSLDYSILWREDTQKRKSFAKLLRNRLQSRESEIELPLVVLCQTRLETAEVMKCLDEEFPKCTHASLTVETPFAERRRTIEEFQQGRLKVLVSTPGIVGRGVELQSARCVEGNGWIEEQILMWSFASSISEFIHHAGRVGRAGEKSSVCVFCNARNKKLFPAFVKLCEENGIQCPAGNTCLIWRFSLALKQFMKEEEQQNTILSRRQALALLAGQSAEKRPRTAP